MKNWLRPSATVAAQLLVVLGAALWIAACTPRDSEGNAGGTAPEPTETAEPTDVAPQPTGGAGGRPSGPQGPPIATPPSRTPTSASASPDILEEYKRRCLGVTKQLSAAVVVWQRFYDMTVDREAAIDVGLTLRTSASPGDVLPEATSPTAEQVQVACRVTGTLIINTNAFSVATETPLTQKMEIVSTEDARWHWLVTPKAAGEYTVSARLAPVVSILDESNPQAFEVNLPSRSFNSRVNVKMSADRAISDTADRWTGVMLKLAAFVSALAVLLAALFRLFTGSWIPGRRSRDPETEQQPGDVADEDLPIPGRTSRDPDTEQQRGDAADEQTDEDLPAPATNDDGAT